MMVENNQKPPYDRIMQEIADYVLHYAIDREEAYDTARLCLLDSLGCAIFALSFPACTRLLGPVVPFAFLAKGARVPGTCYELDPIQAAFNISTMIRWLDFNDTWLAAEWGHPSDNIGAILATTDYLSRTNKMAFYMKDVLMAMIKAYEIQGGLALLNSFHNMGLDHVILVKLASAAVVSLLLGKDRDRLLRTLSQVFVDGQSLRTYRHAPNTGSRKSWAAGDAAARGVRLAWISSLGEMGYPSALTAKKWGFYDVYTQGKPFVFQRPLSSYVMENVLFKIAFPAEFHAQTAIECALALYPQVQEQWDTIQKIQIETHASAIQIISKQGKLHNPADRDHCLQYMVAQALFRGDLQACYYEDAYASHPMIDILREKMEVKENIQFSKDYLDPEKRSIANSIQIFFKDGRALPAVTIEYPLGHKKRREEAIPLLYKKCATNLTTLFSKQQAEKLLSVMQDTKTLMAMPVVDFMDLWSFKAPPNE